MIQRMHVSARHQKGATLIEILITVLILAVGLLGVAALQTQSLSFNRDAYHRSQASVLAYDIIDRMRLNRQNILQYNIGVADADPSAGSLPGDDVIAWRALLASALPQGIGGINCDANDFCTIAVQWYEISESETVTFSYVTRL
ncbi:type IV pilus modification protein PilV [Simiduia curdlanivorans]|uniref:Type IV pilus modification protein PilV n=1 Tax=Simiduia curdlanivorans TaxID=1492769 RepID=A0ABV8V904_9GAMM|nr:type IV pilus modification protein PilV [Simiduia curdlanivorans]MDN3639509.1 type IV pilus modification protein PilV [Simiduia curdlanivorans]